MIRIPVYQAKLSDPAAPAIDGIEYETKPQIEYVGGVHRVPMRPAGTGPVVRVMMAEINELASFIFTVDCN